MRVSAPQIRGAGAWAIVWTQGATEYLLYAEARLGEMLEAIPNHNFGEGARSKTFPERVYVVSRCQLLLALETDPVILEDSFGRRGNLLYAGNMAESIPASSTVELPYPACLSV